MSARHLAPNSPPFDVEEDPASIQAILDHKRPQLDTQNLTGRCPEIAVDCRVPLWFVWTVLLIGATFSIVGVLELQRELKFSAVGVRTEGRVVGFAVPRWSYSGASVDFDIARPQATSPRMHVDHASAIRNWDQGMTLPLVCTQQVDRLETCEVDGFLDRWLEPIVLLTFGLPALVWGAFTVLGPSP